MAKNDKLLLDGIVDDRIVIRQPSDKRDEAFEFFAFEQILKEFDLSADEIALATVDGRGDGGIDGFFVLVNGHLLQDPEAFVWPRTNSELTLRIVTAKHHDTFRQATLDALISTLTEFLDFAVEDIDLKGSYSEALLKMRANLRFAYRKLSPRLSKFSVEVFYASRGDASEIGEEVRSRATQIESLIRESFGVCTSTFVFLGATELVELHRQKPNYMLELPFVDALSKGERYVVLVRLSDYFDFVSQDGQLRRYLFDSNIRAFMGLNRVNEDIRQTLLGDGAADFWWLNNGITILATSAAITGKSIKAADIQIVNGLQTTESIYQYFKAVGACDDDRCVLVKVIVSKDETVRDSIIRATNNQTNVELASLHATDKIQRDIEDILLRHGLFYERRKNFYSNQSRAPEEIVTPLYAASGYVALVLKTPHQAASLRSRFMRSEEMYDAVFSSQATLSVWPAIVRILKHVDAHLTLLRPQAPESDRFLKGWRYIVAFFAVSRLLGKFTYSTDELVALDPMLITQQLVESIWRELDGGSASAKPMRKWTSRSTVMDACESFGKAHSIAGLRALLSKHELTLMREGLQDVMVTNDFVESVRAALPPQPWKPGTRQLICSQLHCSSAEFTVAVDRLIETGSFLRQKHGVLFDPEGNVVGFDPERVDAGHFEQPQ
jgi:AIPR protein